MARKKYTRKSKLPLSKAQYKAVQKASQKAIMKQAETKYKATELDAEPIGPDDQCYVFSNLSNLAQGTDNEQRIGDRVIGTGLHLKYMIELPTTSATNQHYLVRMILINADESEYINPSDQFIVNTAGDRISFTANDNMDVVRSLNRKKFKVLMDKNFSLSYSQAGNGIPVRYGTKFFKFKHDRLFSLDANTSSSHNNLHLVVLCRSASGATVGAGEDIKLTVNARYYYKDF